ncbi:NAD-dependent epimerase/dehydratase family protein [Dactylosporangium sp. CA-092794]|uniref:NAD-dependent epimerase/dehydratase family protein n=1 Tax=Dactylosporangium sp. CA-092794 TaxID=3239929 RepID=UPI003D8D3E45
MKVLYLGGTGAISAACAAASLRRGHEVWLLNRGRTRLRPVPAGVTAVTADLADPASVREALAGQRFDAVVDFLAFTAADAARAVEGFAGRTGQYVFISSASVYDRAGRRIPIDESTPRGNRHSAYSRDKIAAEDAFLAAHASAALPVTIVRPSHTYDEAKPPLPGGWTEVDRLLRGDELVVPADGTSLWTLTHAADLAVGLTGLLGDVRTLGETFHITSDEVLAWDDIYRILAAAAGVEPRLVHVPAELLALAAPDWRWTPLILGDLRFSSIFDNGKIRRFVPDFRPRVTWSEGARGILRWRAEHPGAAAADPPTDRILSRLVTGYHRAAKAFEALAG